MPVPWHISVTELVQEEILRCLESLFQRSLLLRQPRRSC